MRNGQTMFKINSNAWKKLYKELVHYLDEFLEYTPGYIYPNQI